ncbi:MAG TPA: hypothetical protein VGP63_04245 [Planctomycetaceae bacterium]|nr:hypothetical protein [Planctomycetaceae bacterium]
MSIAPLLLALALALSADRPARVANDVLTPEKLLAAIDSHSLKSDSVLLRFRVGSVGVQRVDDAATKTTSQRIVFYTGAVNANGHASLNVALLPRAQAALRRLGITDFAKHFVGREIEVRGHLTSVLTMLYGSPTEYSYYVEVDSLNQFGSAKDVK